METGPLIDFTASPNDLKIDYILSTRDIGARAGYGKGINVRQGEGFIVVEPVGRETRLIGRSIIVSSTARVLHRSSLSAEAPTDFRKLACSSRREVAVGSSEMDGDTE